jgi:REP element-mobilizing transposase RayT
MDRFWLLTWTTYGTWLPGDARGFVSPVREGPGPEVRHNMPGSSYDEDMPGLVRASQSALKGAPVFLDAEQSDVLLQQFRATAAHRGWELLAAAVMANHTHLIVGVPGDPDPSVLLRDFKGYGSRALNGRWPRPAGGTWWTESGSRRKLPGAEAVWAAVEYVKRQANALVIWSAAPGERGASAPCSDQTSGG